MDKMVSGFSGALLSCTPFVENIYFIIDCCSVLCLVTQVVSDSLQPNGL